MELYAKALLYAIPFFILLVLMEVGYGHFVKKQMHRPMDTISSLSSGLTSIIFDSLGIVFIIVSYPYLLEHLAIYEIKETWAVYVVAFIAIDFAGYWNHRLSHKINYFWNQHVIHHSSEEFNLACALRQSISDIIGYVPLLLIPAALVGIPHNVIATLTPIHLFAQFWYHTKHIGKLGFLEYIIVTPSQHRVHHAINEEYIDKNLAPIFCIWDRMFGTFQEELDEVPPVYGVLKPAATWNPILINFQHFWRLLQDAWRTKNYLDKIRIWFMPTGWRPADVKEKYPIAIIEDPYKLQKYDTTPSRLLIYWSILHLVVATALMMFMFYNYANIPFNNLLIYGGIIFLGIYGYTSLMDGVKYAFYVELLRGLLGVGIIFYTQDWFGLNAFSTIATFFVAVYFVITVFGAAYFTYIENKEEHISIVT